MKLYDAAKVIRSKNSGPVSITLDVLFDDPKRYEQVKGMGEKVPSVRSAVSSRSVITSSVLNAASFRRRQIFSSPSGICC